MDNFLNNHIITDFIDILDVIKDKQKSMRERIREEWDESKKLPRKMKKAKRKRLLKQWNIVSYEVFE